MARAVDSIAFHHAAVCFPELMLSAVMFRMLNNMSKKMVHTQLAFQVDSIAQAPKLSRVSGSPASPSMGRRCLHGAARAPLAVMAAHVRPTQCAKGLQCGNEAERLITQARQCNACL
jgi:hypothetical protein